MQPGLFITLEGVEGSGKTTQAAIVGDVLRKSLHRSVTVTHEPGGTHVGEAIRAIFLDPAAALAPGTELMLVLADRAQHVREKLRPALAAGEIVISDRYSDSTIAYQGHGRGFDLKLLTELNALASDGIAPDLTLVLDIPVQTGLARTAARARGTGRGADRIENEREEFHQKVREGFLAIAKREPARVTVLDASQPVEAVTAAILSAIDVLIRRRCR
ncbi:MAG TPA: dTMP kinase [Candidatus Binataceae bacterium]|nr:dTMP kinase [Candidatus Binataceae bacterium]